MEDQPQYEYIQQPQYQMPQLLNNDKADLLDKIKPDLIVEVIRRKLMGEELINGEWIKNPLYSAKAITPIGAYSIAILMLSASSQNVSLSKLTDDEIRKRCQKIVNAVVFDCVDNWQLYGIHQPSQLRYIKEIVFTNTFITLKQPEGEGIRRLLAGTITENRITNTNEEKKGGFLSSLIRR